MQFTTQCIICIHTEISFIDGWHFRATRSNNTFAAVFCYDTFSDYYRWINLLFCYFRNQFLEQKRTRMQRLLSDNGEGDIRFIKQIGQLYECLCEITDIINFTYSIVVFSLIFRNEKRNTKQ